MKTRKPDEFRTSNTSDTTASGAGFFQTGTQGGQGGYTGYAQKDDLSHLREVVDIRLSAFETRLKDFVDGQAGRETRFWVVNGIVLTAIVAIFLFALPDLYKKDYTEKYSQIQTSESGFDKRLGDIEAKVGKIWKK